MRISDAREKRGGGGGLEERERKTLCQKLRSPFLTKTRSIRLPRKYRSYTSVEPYLVPGPRLVRPYSEKWVVTIPK